MNGMIKIGVNTVTTADLKESSAKELKLSIGEVVSARVEKGGKGEAVIKIKGYEIPAKGSKEFNNGEVLSLRIKGMENGKLLVEDLKAEENKPYIKKDKEIVENAKLKENIIREIVEQKGSFSSEKLEKIVNNFQKIDIEIKKQIEKQVRTEENPDMEIEEKEDNNTVKENRNITSEKKEESFINKERLTLKNIEHYGSKQTSENALAAKEESIKQNNGFELNDKIKDGEINLKSENEFIKESKVLKGEQEIIIYPQNKEDNEDIKSEKEEIKQSVKEEIKTEINLKESIKENEIKENISEKLEIKNEKIENSENKIENKKEDVKEKNNEEFKQKYDTNKTDRENNIVKDLKQEVKTEEKNENINEYKEEKQDEKYNKNEYLKQEKEYVNNKRESILNKIISKEIKEKYNIEVKKEISYETNLKKPEKEIAEFVIKNKSENYKNGMIKSLVKLENAETGLNPELFKKVFSFYEGESTKLLEKNKDIKSELKLYMKNLSEGIDIKSENTAVVNVLNKMDEKNIIEFMINSDLFKKPAEIRINSEEKNQKNGTKSRISYLTINLELEKAGKMAVSLVLTDKNRADISFYVGKEKVKESIKEDSENLKEVFSKSGILLKNINIKDIKSEEENESINCKI